MNIVALILFSWFSDCSKITSVPESVELFVENDQMIAVLFCNWPRQMNAMMLTVKTIQFTKKGIVVFGFPNINHDDDLAVPVQPVSVSNLRY